MYTIQINFPAGIVSPRDLQRILTVADEARLGYVRFGSRQQLLLNVPDDDGRLFEKQLKAEGILYDLDTARYPNIISSYCGEAVFRGGDWLGESEYHTILDQFDFRPRLKVNISDANQSFTPFFTGNINFISSPEPHFWYLYVRPRRTNLLFRWRELVYTNDIGRLAKAVETALLSGTYTTEAALYEAVRAAGGAFITQPATQDVDRPEFSLPYYEGFNRYGDKSWLGIYRRNERFPVKFLLDVCALSLKTRIGELCVTPWKSLIIKGIAEADRGAWSYVLGKHNINVRHAANELAWQTEDHSDEGSRLKEYVVRHFDRHDTRTFGLCFGVQTRAKSEVFGSVLVRRRVLLRLGRVPLLSVFDVYHTEQFNPNSRRYISFERGLIKANLPNQLDRLCRLFNARKLAQTVGNVPDEPATQEHVPAEESGVYECIHCLTVYDPTYGDERQGIAPGTLFAALPAGYVCATCEAPKTDLRLSFAVAALVATRPV
jgi:rubredoxin